MVPQPVITADIVTTFLPVGAICDDAEYLELDLSLFDGNFKEARRGFEKMFIENGLRRNNGNISRTAEHIGMERSHLHKKIKTLGIEY